MFIVHDEYKKQTYYGPFDDDEIPERMSDPYALELSLTGRVNPLYIPVDEYQFYYIHPPEFWHDRVEKILDPDPYNSIGDISDEEMYDLGL